MKHNLRTDAALIFEKGADPEMTLFALKRAALLMQQLADAKVSSDITDIYPEPIKNAVVAVSYAKINSLIGLELDKNEILNIINALKFKILSETDQNITVEIPGSKYDVTREVDVIEEILRIYGLNKVPIPQKVAISINVVEDTEKYKIRNHVSEYFVNEGFFEAMSLSLGESEKYQKYLNIENEKLIYINNTSNVNLNIMRPELMLSCLENLKFNINRQIRDISMFEFGRSYQFVKGDILEREFLSFYMTGKRYDESWNMDKSRKNDFYTLKAHVNNLLLKVNVSKTQLTEIENDNRFEYGMSVVKNNLLIGCFGKVNKQLAENLDVKQEVFYCEFDFENLLKFSENRILIEEISKYPVSRRDVAFVIDNSVKFDTIEKTAQKILKKLLKEVNLFDVYKNDDQLGKDKVSYAVSLIFEDKTKTLQDKEIEKELGKFLYVMEKEYGAAVRK